MSKEIVPKRQSDLMLKDDIFISIHQDSINKTEYYKSEISRLKLENDELIKRIDNVKDREDELAFLKSIFKIKCIREPRIMTIFMCAKSIENGECKIFNRCKPRTDLLKKLRLI